MRRGCAGRGWSPLGVERGVMNRETDYTAKLWLWLIPVLLGLSCNYLTPPAPPPPPTPVPVDAQVSQLQASRADLLTGETVEIRVDVIKAVGVEDPFDYLWGTTGGLIAEGQGTCCVTYQAPETAGRYEVQLTVKHENQFVQRTIGLNVAEPTPEPVAVEPTVIPTLVAAPTLVLSGTVTAELVSQEPLTDAQASFERAQVNYVQQDYERAIADYSQAIALNYEPQSEPYYNRAYIYYVQQNYEQAVEDFSRAIELNYEPLNIPYYNRGNAFFYLGDNERAIEDYSKAIELNYEPLSRLYNSRGLAYRRAGELERAIADYSLAIDLQHSPLTWPYYNRGNAYLDQERYDLAIADYTEVILLEAGNTAAYHQRGLAYKGLNQLDRAVVDFNKVLEIGDDYWRREATEQLQELGAASPPPQESAPTSEP